MEKLEMLFPDVAEEFGLDKRINLHFLNMTYESDEIVHSIKHNNKVAFKKDSIDLMAALSFLINLENADSTSPVIRLIN